MTSRQISTVFVYGTLRKGGVREMPLLFPRMAFLGFGRTRGYMYDFGAYPGILLDASGPAIIGEVYEADDAVLARLDAIEEFVPGNPAGSYYLRVPVTVRMADGAEQTCWIYEFNPAFFAERVPIATGDWIAHAAAKGVLPEERWPDGDAIQK